MCGELVLIEGSLIRGPIGDCDYSNSPSYSSEEEKMITVRVWGKDAWIFKEEEGRFWLLRPLGDWTPVVSGGLMPPPTTRGLKS